MKGKKRFLALIAACLLCAGLSTSALAASQKIGVDAAKAAALKYAGAPAEETEFSRAALDKDDGRYEYELKFTWNGVRYECDIDAEDGTVLSYSEKMKSEGKAAKSKAGYIGVKKAKIIALDHAGVAASDADFRKAKLDRDDGRAEYEIEFRFDGAEYEFEIDASTGNILDYEYEVKRR